MVACSVAGGRSTSGFVQDMLLLNLSATGDPLNIRKLDIDESDYPYSLLDLGGGRLMIGGSSGEFGFQPERDMVLIKTGTTGVLAGYSQLGHRGFHRDPEGPGPLRQRPAGAGRDGV